MSILNKRRAIVLAAAVAIAAAGCSSSGSSTTSSTTTPTTTTSTPAATSTAAAGTTDTSSCGTKPGVAATGTPINLGGIVTDQPGTSFTDIANMAAAYFACVNANGGINGHPIMYYIEKEQTNASQIASEAKQLVQTDHVVGIVGTSYFHLGRDLRRVRLLFLDVVHDRVTVMPPLVGGRHVGNIR